MSTSQTESSVTTVIGLLGPVGVVRDVTAACAPGAGEPVPVAGVRARRLLASLAMAEGRVRTAERLIDDVWGTDRPGSPAAALHTQISRLRPVLGPARVEAVAGGYRLTGCRTDLSVVAELAASGDPADLAAAQTWWRGVPGDDLGDADVGLASELRSRANALREAVDRGRLAALLAGGDFAEARTVAERLCATDNLDETAHVGMMRALAGQGATAAALAVFDRLRRSLTAELGADPGPEAAAVHAELLAATAVSGAGSAVPPQVIEPTGRGPRSKVVGVIADSSELVGRDHDISAILDLLGRYRLVTLQGPGGVGKTRVSHRVGARLARAGRSVFYVPLAPIRNDDDVVGAIAATLGVGDTEWTPGGRPRRAVADLTARIVDEIRGLGAVLILDNCEQVVARCALLVAELLTAEPDLVVLTTSRSPLLLAAEHIYQLPALGVDVDGASAELFGRRARAIRRSATLDPIQVAGLCARLDGLPLAIELAAARIRTMSVGEITARLDERFGLLRGSDRSAPDRHRTLYAVIDWSWDLLGDDARSALRRLCRFPAGFTADTAAAVLGYGGYRIDDVLEELVNQSLLAVVETVTGTRYRMLETVREFGETTLAADPGLSRVIDVAICCWARSFALSVSAEYEHDFASPALLDRVAAETENLLWVLRRCVAAESGRPSDDEVITVVTVFPVLGGLWVIRGLHSEVIAWSAKVVPILPRPPAGLPDELRKCWQATVLVSSIHQMMHHDLRHVARCRMLLRALIHRDKVLTGQTDFLSALALAVRGPALHRLIVSGVRAGTPRVALIARGLRMAVRENTGSLDPALRDGLHMLELTSRYDDVWLSAMPKDAVAGIYGQRGQWERSIGYYHDAIAGLERISATEDSDGSRCYLAAALTALGRFDEAEQVLAPVAGGWTVRGPEPQGHTEVVAAMMMAWAEIRYGRGDRIGAAEAFGRSAALIHRDHPFLSSDPGAVMLLSGSVAGLLLCGETDTARIYLDTLCAGLRSTISGRIWLDLPQGATIALVVGLLLNADARTGDKAPGARLMALGVRLGARQDLPSLHRAVVDAQPNSGLSEDDWASMWTQVVRRSRRQVREEILDFVVHHVS
ncbi:AAA domain-containing protein [Gordonia pseudamarae]|uniref:BTAD domain-containing putative transcriptional regulator n=1 Tax=Gordonia pseudamarae TaxID=2831662 RepID=UPI001AF85E18|nr:BTAD domain-containing putative transcriptional regulator [Gordonia pseudamarae]QHN25661.1 AAA domain-containing protein [Gordonia pseudamarae]